MKLDNGVVKLHNGAMTSTPATGAHHFTAGNGTSVHRGVTMPESGSYTACGAEGRGMRISRLKVTDAPVTCNRCIRKSTEAAK